MLDEESSERKKSSVFKGVVLLLICGIKEKSCEVKASIFKNKTSVSVFVENIFSFLKKFAYPSFVFYFKPFLEKVDFPKWILLCVRYLRSWKVINIK